MLIKILFSSIKDQTLLYEPIEEQGENPFGENCVITTQVSKSKEYSEAVMSEISNSVSCLSFRYMGSMERIARETFDVQIGDVSFEVAFVVDTGEDRKSSLTVEIGANDNGEEQIEKRYIKCIEQFKVAVKNRLLRDFDNCIWIADDQSEMLGARLYPRFFKTENQIRAFVNKVLIAHLGHNWLELPGFEKYKLSTVSLGVSFKQIVSDFANINTTMLSMTLETLAEIILEAVVYKDQILLSLQEVTKLCHHLSNKNSDAAKELITKKREAKVKIWDDLFAQYLPEENVFRKQLNIFIKSRNHVAHNKLLTFSVFKQMNDELTAFDSMLRSATILFETQHASIEMIDTLQAEQEQTEYEEQYWRDRIFGETGVEVRDEDEIYELLCQTVTELYDTLSDRYHYDPCFDVSDMEIPVKDGTTKVLTITSNASDEKLNLFVSIVLDDDMDSSSYLTIEAKHGEDIIAKAECTYHNGEGHEGEEGLCVADSDSEYDDTEVHDFLEDLVDYIEEDLNPYVKQVATMEYECGRHGGASPVADFACQECGKDGVSITEDLLPIGKCCYCGYENEHYVCELCGTVYDDMGGDEHLCNGCMPKDDE